MPQSLAQIYLHIIFSTKGREPFLKEKEFRGRLHAYLVGICRNLKCPSLIVGGVADHVHILCRYGRGISVSDFVREIKRPSSGWVKNEVPKLGSFKWQDGYGAFSVSPSHVAALKKYIANQEEHHKTETFQEEYRRLLNKYGIEYDERYVWD
jgi:REP element-mobilizing transposase RayT